jgi:RIO-like serine/threonine protein kinase
VARIEPQKPDRTFNRSREFQREVLAYLKEHGPQPYDVLYVHFDPNRTAEIETVLRELIQWKFIDRGTDSYLTVSITVSGIARLGLKDI